MPRRLRIFVSSSMRDLQNERVEVSLKLAELNFEPVIAEDLLPDGSDSWHRLKAEIESCDMFVLILGEIYGYIPMAGPMAGTEKSVTELEFDVAKAADMPVLPFMKRLRQSQPLDDDAQRREHFRERVAEWDDGFFRGEFNLARDLAENVAKAVIGLIADDFRAGQPERRRDGYGAGPSPSSERVSHPSIPPALREAAKARQVTLLLGAGASLSTGMPSAAAFVKAMQDRLQEVYPAYSAPKSGTPFNVLATDFEALLGSDTLYSLAGDLVDPMYVTESAPAHHIAARLFDEVITTNFDCLLERAKGGDEFYVIDGEADQDQLSRPRRLFKIHGSISNPKTLVLTEADSANLEEQRGKLWTALGDLLMRQPLLVIGSSLRDPSLIRLLEDYRSALRGWVVMPDFNPSEHTRLRRWHLDLIQGDADSLLTALIEG